MGYWWMDWTGDPQTRVVEESAGGMGAGIKAPLASFAVGPITGGCEGFAGIGFEKTYREFLGPVVGAACHAETGGFRVVGVRETIVNTMNRRPGDAWFLKQFARVEIPVPGALGRRGVDLGASSFILGPGETPWGPKGLSPHEMTIYAAFPWGKNDKNTLRVGSRTVTFGPRDEGLLLAAVQDWLHRGTFPDKRFFAEVTIPWK